MIRRVEIMFDDLNRKKQRDVLEFYGYDSPREGNFAIVPLLVFEREG